MGKRGPPRLPTEVLLARGSRHAKGRALEGQVHPERKPPPQPDWLTEKAAKVWHEVIAVLREMGVLTVADGRTIGRYCQTYCDWVEVDKEVRMAGAWYEMPNGMKRPHPAVKLRLEYAKILKECEAVLGLTPAARAHLNVTVAWMPGAKPVAAPDPQPAPKAKGGATPPPIDGDRFFRKA